MAVTYKDINQLTQKGTVAGTEKLPVSDTEYITPAQIVAGKENSSNKVVSLSSSSTDTQYPSAKCVYDIVGDIESVLDAIINGTNNNS